jgi:hypothetical protein
MPDINQTQMIQYFGQFFNDPVSLTEEALPFLTDFLKLSAELKP